MENSSFRKLLRLKTFTLRVVVLPAFLFANSSVAQPQQVDPDHSVLDSQRFHYQKAKLALAGNRIDQFQEHFGHLDDYPLKQYLEYGQIRQNLRLFPFKEADEFFQNYPDSFLATRLRANLLHFLASRKRWNDYLKYYDPSLASVELKCHALYSQIQTSKNADEKNRIYLEVAELWDVEKSQPDGCNTLFGSWQKAGYRTEEILWSRFDKMMQAGKVQFATYLSKQLVTNKPMAELYLKVNNSPNLITQRQNFKGTDTVTQQIIAHGIRKLAEKAPLDALYHWEMYEAQQLFPKDVIQQTKQYVVKRLIRTGHSVEAQQLLSYSHSLRKDTLAEEIIREALAEQDWNRVAATLNLLEPETRNSERWLYWAARAQEELGISIEGYPSIEGIYKSLAQNRSFYGFMSSDKLKRNYSLLDHSENVDPNDVARVANLGGMKRAYELWLTGNTTEAHAEWLHLSVGLNNQELLAVGQLAKDWGWYNTGIQAMISGNLWDQLTVRFPLAYRDEIYKIANDSTVEPTLIYAIARQESAFDFNAKSPVGAMGLMQLMPKTALFTAKKAGIAHTKTNDLFDATHNMRIGSEYLNQLLNKFEGNRILVAAAYNAGPSRVAKWLSEEGKEKPVDIWIETIPYKETRQYVQNILCFSVIYSYRLGYPTIFLSEEEAKRYL